MNRVHPVLKILAHAKAQLGEPVEPRATFCVALKALGVNAGTELRRNG